MGRLSGPWPHWGLTGSMLWYRTTSSHRLHCSGWCLALSCSLEYQVTLVRTLSGSTALYLMTLSLVATLWEQSALLQLDPIPHQGTVGVWTRTCTRTGGTSGSGSNIRGSTSYCQQLSSTLSMSSLY